MHAFDRGDQAMCVDCELLTVYVCRVILQNI